MEENKQLETNVVFVSNIDYHADRDEFQQFREEICGEWSLAVNEKWFKMATILTDRETRRSRWIGFATFNNDEDAQKVVSIAETEEWINFRGRRLKVVFAEKREPRPASSY